MIKTHQFLSSKAASRDPLETKRASIKLMASHILLRLASILGNGRNMVDTDLSRDPRVLNTGLPRCLRYGWNVFGSDWDFRLATPERQAEVRRLTL